jgi:hypothetical protein
MMDKVAGSVDSAKRKMAEYNGSQEGQINK